jgi:uncharacterized protein (DUF924 family)
MRDTKLEVLKFWFEESVPAQWFQRNDVYDKEIKSRFLCTYDMVMKDMCRDWAREPEGILALCLVLDQFPRNMFRDTPKSFEADEKAVSIAKDAIYKGFDKILPPIKRRFIYLPFEHSEKLTDQEKSLELFAGMKESDPMAYEYAQGHYNIIRKFGRFPHRNKILGRESTAEEKAFLENESRF